MTTLSQHEKNFDDNPKKAMIKGLTWFIGIVLIIGGIFWLGSFILTPAKSAKDVVQKTLDADNVLGNYEFFEQQFEDWKTISKKIKNHEEELVEFKEMTGPKEKWDFMDKTEYSRLRSIVTGLKDQKEDIESKYNARSKMKNRELFKSKNLPHSLDDDHIDNNYNITY